MLDLIISQYNWIREIERNLYGLRWAIQTFFAMVSVVGIAPSFFTGLIVKKRGFLYGCIVAMIFLVLYILITNWVLKSIAGGLEYDFTYNTSQEYCKMITFTIAGGSSVLVGGFMGLAGEKLRRMLKKE